MFTGLIERTGALDAVERRGNGSMLRISAGGWNDPLDIGESIAVNGICLTVSDISSGAFHADILQETLMRTSLGKKRKGAMVNLERALKVGDRFGGHIVSGHIDGTGVIHFIRKTGSDYILRTACDPSLMLEIVTKGSVALDGMSLTVTSTGSDWFEVHIIPHTWDQTTLSKASVGDNVNIESDIIAKYVKKYTQNNSSGDSILASMKKAGFS